MFEAVFEKMEMPSQHPDRIQQRFLAFGVSTVRVNNDGLVNKVVIVNDELIFRFPKNELAKQSLAHETRISAH
jgi:hypothetical protein